VCSKNQGQQASYDRPVSVTMKQIKAGAYSGSRRCAR
jgi:hypothetical protein